ncbi:hypothetical protein H4F18_16525 [Vibrio scophthalmi]|uniref:hypothetical protein n=1 Tax=Vibrio scophthalmi TaxID=45658 RepID=UPI002FF356B9
MPISAIAGPLVAGKVVSNVIEDLIKHLEDLSVALQNTTNNLAEDLLGQVEVTAFDIIEELNDVLEEQVETLDDKLQRKLYAIVAAVEKLRIQLNEDITNISKEFNRDLRQTLAKVSFIGEIYSLDTIDNTLVPFNHKGDWTLIAKGVGVGFDSEDVASNAQLIIDIDESGPLEITGLEVSDTQVNFVIPSRIIEAERDKYTSNKIRCVLKFEITEDRTLWFDNKFVVELPVYITVAPDFIANVSAQMVKPVFDWVRRPEHDQVSSKGCPSGHATSSSDVRHHHLRWTMELPTNILKPREGDLKFVGAVDGGCHSSGCGFRKFHELRVVNGGKKINIHHENWSHAITIRVLGQVAQYERVSDIIKDSEYELLSSESMEVVVPKDFQSLRFEGITREGRKINLTIERNPHTEVYPIPQGEWGGMSFNGVTKLTNQVMYRFSYDE